MSLREDALDRILGHSWPGNVRELENVIARAIALAPRGAITAEEIEFPRRQVHAADWLAGVPYEKGYMQVLREVAAHLIKTALSVAEGNKLKAASVLGIQRRLLYEKMHEYGLG